jgi:peptide/nickel transport system substrate-binding protein
MRQFEKLVLDTEAHEIFLLWRYRIVPYRSYVKGWKVSPSHYVNQDLATIWLNGRPLLTSRAIASCLNSSVK